MKWMVVVLFLLAIPVTFAAEPYHMTLLAAREESNGTLSGGTADLYVEIQPGKGRIFLETFPLTRVDTQISTRFAKEIACNYFDLDCDDSDFIYTIKSDSSIIGGPSAGAAIAALSTAALLDVSVDPTVAVTGTINSGGLIGTVGGLQAKVDAAASSGIKTVLIPMGTRMLEAGENETLDLVEYGRQKNVTVVEVGDLNEVFYHFTGQRLLKDGLNITADSDYVQRMKAISEELCARSNALVGEIILLNQSDRDYIRNQTTKASRAASEEAYYSSASYCFGLNVQLQNLVYKQQELTKAKLMSKAAQLQREIQRLETDVRGRELHTITDLQTFTIVVERVDEAQRYADRVADEDIDSAKQSLAYAEERFFSAQQWATFFDVPSTEYTFNSTVLQRSCIEKLQEAKERLHYLELFTNGLGTLQEDIDRAEQFSQNKSYEQCLIKASEAKAHANAVLSTVGVDQRELPLILDVKLAALGKHISRTIEKRAFPLLGYSYYEYARSLRDYDMVSALLYAEYGLELSNLDIYFEEEKKIENRVWIPVDLIFAVAAGILIGLVAAYFIRGKKRRSAVGNKTRRDLRRDPGGKKR
jgi:uncharacterized protein